MALSVERLRISNLNVSIRNDHSVISILHSVSLTLNRGETLGIIGRSGEGKTLLAHSLLHLLDPPLYSIEDQYVLEGRDLRNLSSKEWRKLRGADLSLIPQNAGQALNPYLTVGSQMDDHLANHVPLNKIDRQKRIIDGLKMVGLTSPEKILDSRPHVLSGGLCQRALVALALLCKPKVLIADEPTSALDGIARKTLIETLISIQRTTQMSLILISHDLELIETLSHRVLCLQNGQLDPCEATIQNKARHSTPKYCIQMARSPNENQFKSPPVLEVENLIFDYSNSTPKDKNPSTPLLNGISLKIHRSEILGLQGPSGCGKSTLGQIIVGLTRASAGVIRVEGRDHHLQTSLWRPQDPPRVQYLFQDSAAALDPRFSIEKTLNEPFQIQKIKFTRAERQVHIDRLLDQVGLKEIDRSLRPHQMSGGQLQRLCLARALALSPALIIADEITSALDPETQFVILERLRTLVIKTGLSVLFISHDLHVLNQVSDQIVELRDGKLIEIKDTDRDHSPSGDQETTHSL